MRSGLDPHMVLALVDIESKFKKYAVSRSGARGLMQVMPFWVKEIGEPAHNLFHERTNLRYGCTILRHYLDRERGCRLPAPDCQLPIAIYNDRFFFRSSA